MTAALAGGAIGALITLVVALPVRFSTVPREVTANDRKAADRDSDLELWVIDESYALERRIASIRAGLASRQMIQSGSYAMSIRDVKDASLHAYRDQARQPTRDVAAVYDHEIWLHDRWRGWKNLERQKLSAPDKVVPVLDAWRSPPASDQGRPPALEIVDPTGRTLARLIERVAANPGAYQ